MPVRKLPASADITHLKNQAKDLLSEFRAAKMAAYQRIREFHPKMSGMSDQAIAAQTFSLSDALLSIAREYGYPSWPRLKTVVAEQNGQTAMLDPHERITDQVFLQAIDFMDEGNEALLRKHLADHPQLIHQRMNFEGDNYFTNPTLIEFIAENPFRQKEMPDNVIEIARIVLEAGAKENQKSLDETLMLVASGQVSREQGAQIPMLNLLCDYGADPNTGVGAALVHSELDATRTLLQRGATLDLPAAAALGEMVAVHKMLKSADDEQRQTALAMAAQNNATEVVQVLLEAGADPNRYNPPGGHSHCTALQSAIAMGHIDVVKILVEAGADLSIRDILHDAPALVWAEYANSPPIKKAEVFAYIKTKLEQT